MRSPEDQAAGTRQHKTPGKPGHAASAPERHGKSGSAEPRDKPGSTASDSARKRLRINTRNRTAKSPAHKISDTLLVKHAGLSPSGNASGAFEGQAHISRRGRPGLRLTVWRAIWPLLIHNSVMAAKYAAMIAAANADAETAQAAPAQSGTGSRQASAVAATRARRAKARVACAAALDLLHRRPRYQLGS